jgi:hypothetical protein
MEEVNDKEQDDQVMRLKTKKESDVWWNEVGVGTSGQKCLIGCGQTETCLRP